MGKGQRIFIAVGLVEMVACAEKHVPHSILVRAASDGRLDIPDDHDYSKLNRSPSFVHRSIEVDSNGVKIDAGVNGLFLPDTRVTRTQVTANTLVRNILQGTRKTTASNRLAAHDHVCDPEPTKRSRRAAFALIGMPFRSKYFPGNVKAMCTEGTVAAQRHLAKNHIENIVKPLEDLGLTVDIFLSDFSSYCRTQRPSIVTTIEDLLVDENRRPFNSLEMLKEMYSVERFHSAVPMCMVAKDHAGFVPDQHSIRCTNQSGNDMFEHIAQMVTHVQHVSASSKLIYEYLIFLRYDVLVDAPFTTLLDTSAISRGLNFFTYAHDYFFGIPGTYFTCMARVWNDCLSKCKVITAQCPFKEHCYRFGNLKVPDYSESYGGYVSTMKSLEMALVTAQVQPYRARRYQQAGVTVVSDDGVEHWSYDFGSVRDSEWRPPLKGVYGDTPNNESTAKRFLPFYYHMSA